MYLRIGPTCDDNRIRSSLPKESVMRGTNEGLLDRSMRILIGSLLIALVFVGPKTPLGWLGLVPLATGIVGFCPFYRLLGINTCRAKR